jgi:hypothetical protein
MSLAHTSRTFFPPKLQGSEIAVHSHHLGGYIIGSLLIAIGGNLEIVASVVELGVIERG